jgi:hypothetical protein
MELNKHKYIKYKTKYLQLKQQLGGDTNVLTLDLSDVVDNMSDQSSEGGAPKPSTKIVNGFHVVTLNGFKYPKKPSPTELVDRHKRLKLNKLGWQSDKNWLNDPQNKSANKIKWGGYKPFTYRDISLIGSLGDSDIKTLLTNILKNDSHFIYGSCGNNNSSEVNECGIGSNYIFLVPKQ